MIFGDPQKFAIWVEYVPQWGDSYKNGLFYLIINSNMYPKNIRVATLSADLYEIIDNGCALITQPQNKHLFELSSVDAFKSLLELAHPESSEADEYPEQNFDYCITSSNISNFGGCFFAIANETSVRVIGAQTECLIWNEKENRNYWEYIEQPIIDDVTISKDEMNNIIKELREYSLSIFNIDRKNL